MALIGRNKKQPAKDLTREVGVAGDVIFNGYDNEEARTDNVSIKKYREMMDKDPTVESLYNIFTLPIVAATYRIDADEDDTGETQAEFIRKNLLSPPHKGGIETPMSLFLDQLLMSIVDGFQLWEKVYELRDGKYVLKKLAHRDSIGLTLIRDDDGGYGGVHQMVSFGGKTVDVIMKPHKTFLFTHNKARDYLYGRSSFQSLRKPYEKKSRLEYLDSIALQADAIKPKVLIRTENTTVDDDDSKGSLTKRILGSLSKLGERNAVASIPYGYDIKEITQKGRDPHQSIERQNSEMARAFQATHALLGSQGGSNVGSYALSDNLSDMLMITLSAFMTKVEEHINQYLIADLHDINFATPHYAEFHFDDLTSDTIEVMTEAFQKLLEKDRISDEMVEGIEKSTANRLEIDIDQIKKERKKRADKEAKEAARTNKPQGSDDSESDGDDDDTPSGSQQLSDISSRDFPGLHEDLGVDSDKLGCIMLDLQTFDVLKHVEGGQADLVQATKPEDHVMGAVAESEAHVTLLFGLLQNGNTMKAQVDKVLAGWRCDSVVLSEVTSFSVPPEAEAVPIVANIQAWDLSGDTLQEANKRLSLLPHVNTFGNYNPHVTIAYVKNDPDVVQKWTKALNQVIPGMRLSSTGINYGDAPAEDDEEDDAGDGGKFLSEDGNEWHRPLTEAENTVRFADINTKMDGFEESFLAKIQPIVDEVTESVVASAEGADPTKFEVMLPPDYESVIFNAIKEAYNYAKTGAADELNASAPATSKEALTGMRELTTFIVEKQQDDLKNLVRAELLKARRTSLELAEGDEEEEEPATVADKFKAALAGVVGVWFVAKLKATATSIVSQGVNNGRADVFDGVAKPGDLFQYSGLLDGKICRICSDLDGKVVDYEEYRRTQWKPPIHFHCRCLWILIRKVSESFAMPEVTGLPEVAGDKTEPLI